MKDLSNAPACEYANDLISFVYSELSDKESQQFKLHLNTCEHCSDELDSFGEMRDAIGAWKYQSLTAASSTQETQAAPTSRKKSAVAAVREFFTLSPLWMKGAVGFATVVFCVLAVIATGQLSRTQTSVPPVATVRTYSQQEVDALVTKARAEAGSTQNQTTAVKDDLPQQKAVQKNVERQRTDTPQFAQSRRPLSKSERAQLAADLRLASRNDDTVDLISDRINE